MRIIDKQNDYYDYLQDNEDTLVFDRRGSYLLTKEDILRTISRRLNTYYRDPENFLLFQCGVTYWLIYIKGLDIKGESPNRRANDYSLKVVTSWKEYNQPMRLLSLRFIDINQSWIYDIWNREFKGRRYIISIDEDKLMKEAPKLKDAIIHKDYKILGFLDEVGTWKSDYNSYGSIILKASGIPNIISPEEVYNAIDEYFSLTKTAAESTTAKGTTNNDKIKNHGFDTKTSFRGK